MYSKHSKCSPVWPFMNKNLEVDGPKAGPATQMPTQGLKSFLSFHCAIFSDSLVDGLMIAKWLLQLQHYIFTGHQHKQESSEKKYGKKRLSFEKFLSLIRGECLF